MFDEEEEGGRGRKCCVLDGTVGGYCKSLNHFLYKYIIFKSNYLINDSSSYELLALGNSATSQRRRQMSGDLVLRAGHRLARRWPASCASQARS